MEHVNSFQQHSRFKVWALNTELGFPKALNELQFQIIILHYSLWNPQKYLLNPKFLHYLKQSHNTYKIAFYQDEYHHCKRRFDFINEYKIDCIHTLLEPAYFKEVYQKYTNASELVYTLTGYVSQELVSLARQLTKPDKDRRIDVGYRGRPLPWYMGKGAREKTDIALGFRERARDSGLKLDIETELDKRIYGKAWFEFLADCRAVLGVEAGVSIFDLEDQVRLEYERLRRDNPAISFAEMSQQLLQNWENNIPYRTISPRHFEAAALRVCQILFEGEYSGIMQPMVHYIPLKKDFSNFDEVMARFRDESLRRELTENAHRDLVASGRYSYEQFIRSFDEKLRQTGFQADVAAGRADAVTALLRQDLLYRRFWAAVRAARYYPFPGRELIVPKIKALMGKNANI